MFYIIMNKNKWHIVYDSCGKYIKSFPTYKQAMTFKIANGRLDWEIK